MTKCWRAQFFDRRTKAQTTSTAVSANGKMHVHFGATPSPTYAACRTKGKRYLLCGTGRHNSRVHSRLTSRFQSEGRTHSIPAITETAGELEGWTCGRLSTLQNGLRQAGECQAIKYSPLVWKDDVYPYLQFKPELTLY